MGIWLDQWLAQKRPRLKQGSIEQYEYVIEKHIKPDLGTLRLDKVTPAHIEMAITNTIKRCSAGRKKQTKRPRGLGDRK